MYEYNAKVTKVYDADTITVDIDCGFGIWYTNQKIRLFGINAPEIRSYGKKKVTDEEKKKGLEAKIALQELILDKTVQIETVKDKKGKFGRYLAIIYLDKGEGITMLKVNDWLVEKGYAEEAKY